MRIRISEIEDGPVARHYDLSKDWMADALSGVMSTGGRAEGAADLMVSLTGTTVTVTGRVDASFDVPCSRCLEPAEVRVFSPFRLVMVKGHEPDFGEEELELGPADLELAYYEGPELDLAPHVREHLLLAVPIAPLCRSDCWPAWFDGNLVEDAALSEQDGDTSFPANEGGTQRTEEEKIDPRWAPLAKLLAKAPRG